MQEELGFTHNSQEYRAISPFKELGAYEALWLEHNFSFKKAAELFSTVANFLPSACVHNDARAYEYAHKVFDIIKSKGIKRFGVRVYGTWEYPQKLRDARYPIQFLYFRGNWDLIESPTIAVVGTRSPSVAGIKRTQQLVTKLVDDGYTIVSGLAKGVDTVAHKTAIEHKGRTIAVIGTPISEYYPKENIELQNYIGENFLLISQIPVCRYLSQHPGQNRLFFPERNKTMSAISEGTIIVEAGETSGTLVQAKAALEQGRKLFILNSCFENSNLTWPHKYQKLGAIRVNTYDDIRQHLNAKS